MTPSNDKPQPADAQAPEGLRQQVEETRQELGETAEALAAKADIKAQAQQTGAAVTEQPPTVWHPTLRTNHPGNPWELVKKRPLGIYGRRSRRRA
ncbi:DUF3618 domain-containing protein [Streptomyces sp. NPDC006692]|uniref:DUF3618 domain-containing protein n=1 Tax=unclassified Streptomyces TaxID=2593676 RepID=UPI00367AC852